MIDYSSLSILLLVLIIVIGLAFLYGGGEWLCRGGTSLALRFHVAPLVVGLTIVAMATSLPELVTSLISAYKGSPGIAVGNIVGSNIANVGLILGIAAMMWPMQIHARIIRLEMPILVGVSILLMAFAANGTIQRWQGIVLLVIFIVYIVYITKEALKEKQSVKKSIEHEVKEHEVKSVRTIVFFLIGGAVALWLGAELLVNASIETARRAGISEDFIGLTVVAVGTSLPELATSVVAAMRKESDICAGNLVGSNLFNILFIGGTVSTLYPLTVSMRMVAVDFSIMILLTLLIWKFFVTDKEVTRKEGALLVIFYIGFIVITGLSQGWV
ncbi:MAG: sodium:calcium antiporter [Verrucomicrobia bacterium CG_4_10_14_3_um_filter_43_23]|nr:MAG: hypothetical protein AUJ82_06660 [Verrucomicrobia bacterium CG1_02_43_26]PIP59772.1 MAG: sodium:calcium antiporter [Verrucomicrobia bacterium CG22_combo_CG10-13_8_21_14_all_43_17]PIX58761.1 MAG: sodium:calcium antiporter [Verrucomicrobia bacterium CG_4_10_14_3_um_filter_43_23]PIY61114.1 MAG: sodium:calcium antiporter [Verrucomicrobia bacterium CG_4_10_14_0_8_um_filter_43_34]PJA43518.1 MAG: sodium:calcium antiporter [Verrucomicrobia bacterium CG_4_9_14_3_um_filter_43_20]